MTTALKKTPKAAMVLAAGLGKRMRPITDTLPKPLVKIAGRTLLDRGLDSLAEAGVEKAVVNVHYLAEQIVAHVADRGVPHIVISDESDGLLDSAGGIIKALPELGSDPFYLLNADTFWIDASSAAGERNLDRLAHAWDAAAMDILLMLADPGSATGHSGGTDFVMDRIGAEKPGMLSRAHGDPEGLIYAGAAIINPAIFDGAPDGPLSLNRYFDEATAKGRLFGLQMLGSWITVGTPDAIAPAEAVVERAAGIGAS